MDFWLLVRSTDAGSLCGLIGALLAFAGHCWAEDVIRENPSGGVNWTEGVVFAHGFGTAKPGLSAGQKTGGGT